MQILLARFSGADDFRERSLADQPHGGVFIPSRQRLEPGSLVVVDIRLPELEDKVLIRGKVAYCTRRNQASGSRSGIAVAFLPSETRTREYLMAAVNGDSGVRKRRHRRLPTTLPIDVRIGNDREERHAVLDDISTGGAFIRAEFLPGNVDNIVLEITPPGALAPQAIEGRVAWQAKVDDANGFGVEFRWRDLGGLRRLRELVKRLERHGAV